MMIALPGRLELPALRLTASRSNQLSYGSICGDERRESRERNRDPSGHNAAARAEAPPPPPRGMQRGRRIGPKSHRAAPNTGMAQELPHGLVAWRLGRRVVAVTAQVRPLARSCAKLREQVPLRTAGSDIARRIAWQWRGAVSIHGPWGAAPLDSNVRPMGNLRHQQGRCRTGWHAEPRRAKPWQGAIAATWPRRLVARASRCDRDLPSSTPGAVGHMRSCAGWRHPTLLALAWLGALIRDLRACLRSWRMPCGGLPLAGGDVVLW